VYVVVAGRVHQAATEVVVTNVILAPSHALIHDHHVRYLIISSGIMARGRGQLPLH